MTTHATDETAAHGHLAHQFDNLEQQRITAVLGMWTFLATEVMFFGGMFAGYLVYRLRHLPEWIAASRHLDLTLGTVNTAVLLTSSLTMAFAVHAAQQGCNKHIRRWIAATVLLAFCFLGIKGYEYQHKWHEGLIPGGSFHWKEATAGDTGPFELFFSFYFVMTGVHAVHMLIGIGILAVLYWRATQNRFTSDSYNAVENMGLYWHFVDIIWVFLFPLLYLIDRS